MSSAPAAGQSSPLEQATASPGLSLPAWASFLPKGGKTLGALAPAPSNGVREPLFVSAALVPVPSPAVRKIRRTPANARLGPRQPPPASAPARPSPGSVQPVTTGNIAAAGPLFVAPTGGRPRSLPAPVHTSAAGTIAPPTNRQATQLATETLERTSHRTGQPTQSTPRPASPAVPPAGNEAVPVAGTAKTPKAADQVAQRAVRARRPALPITPAPNPEGSSAASQSEKKNPCTVANGRLDCGEPR